ncbi:MAG: hypothetical protein ACR2P5_03900 [Gammaproteobacteria bacterium]
MNDNIHIYMDAYSVMSGAAEIQTDYDAEHWDSIYFRNLFELARNRRNIASVAVAAPKGMELLRTAIYGLRENKTEVASRNPETEISCADFLAAQMLRDALRYSGGANTAVLITGDGCGFADEPLLLGDAAILRKNGWKVEIMSWRQISDPRMVQWAQKNGAYIAMENFYDSITMNKKGARLAKKLDLSKEPDLTVH